MKTIEKNIYSEPALEAYVREQLKDLDQQLCADAEQYAIKNKPPLLEKNIKSYFVEHHQKAQSIIDHISTELQPATLISEVVEDETKRDRILQGLQNKLRVVKDKAYEHEKLLKDKKQPYSTYRIPLMWVLIFVPLLGDGILNRPTFETYGYTFIESCAMSLLLATALTILAHLFDRIVALGKTLWQRRAIATGIIVIVTCLFYYLADTRASYLANEALAEGAILRVSPIAFTLISTVLFVVAVALNHFFFPTAEQRNAMREYQSVRKQHEELQQEISRIEQEIETTKQAHEALRHMNGSIYVYGSKLEDMVITHSIGGFAKFKKVNMMHRPDNGRPPGFDSDEYPYFFTKHFTLLKQI
jgi:hypothetical protein